MIHSILRLPAVALILVLHLYLPLTSKLIETELTRTRVLVVLTSSQQLRASYVLCNWLAFVFMLLLSFIYPVHFSPFFFFVFNFLYEVLFYLKKSVIEEFI